MFKIFAIIVQSIRLQMDNDKNNLFSEMLDHLSNGGSGNGIAYRKLKSPMCGANLTFLLLHNTEQTPDGH